MEENEEKQNSLFRLMKNEGNHKHNLQVCTKGSGELIVLRCPANAANIKVGDYLPCLHCFAWVSEKHYGRHACPERKKTNLKGTKKQAKLLVLSAKYDNSVARVLASLADDNIAQVIQNDFLLMDWLKCSLESKQSQSPSCVDNFRVKLRYGARLLAELKKTEANANWLGVLTSRFFAGRPTMEVITEATNACAVRGEDNYVFAVTPLKIGYVLNALLERAREKLMEDKNLEGLQTLDSLSCWKSRAWKTEVSSNCRQILQSRKDQSKVVPVLPTAPDIKKRGQDLSEAVEEDEDTGAADQGVYLPYPKTKASNRCPCLNQPIKRTAVNWPFLRRYRYVAMHFSKALSLWIVRRPSK